MSCSTKYPALMSSPCYSKNDFSISVELRFIQVHQLKVLLFFQVCFLPHMRVMFGLLFVHLSAPCYERIS